MAEIKRLDEARWKEIRDLRLEALVRDPTAFCSAYEEEATMGEEVWRRRSKNTLFAVIDNKAVGMIALGFNDRQRTKHIAALYGVYVRKESRGQGIGRKLVEAAVKDISGNPEISKIELTVNAAEATTVRTYEKCGFERVVSHRNDGAGGYNCKEVLMEKRIKCPETQRR